MADTPVFTATVATVSAPNLPTPVQLDMLHQLLVIPEVGVDVRGGCYMTTPLCAAIQHGCPVVVKLLLEHGADPSILSELSGRWQQTAMHEAVAASCTFEAKRSIILELFAYNADINVRSAAGVTALHMACKLGYVDVANLLLQLDAKIDVVTARGQTVLMSAVGNQWEQQNAVPIVRLLIQYGADVLDVDSNNRTLLHTMVAWETTKNLPLARFLIENGVQDNKDHGGMTAGDFAISEHPHEGVRFAKRIQPMFKEHQRRLFAFAMGNRERGRHASLVIRGAHDWASRQTNK